MYIPYIFGFIYPNPMIVPISQDSCPITDQDTNSKKRREAEFFMMPWGQRSRGQVLRGSSAKIGGRKWENRRKTIGKWDFNGVLMVVYGDLMGCNGIYPLKNIHITMENHHLYSELLVYHVATTRFKNDHHWDWST